MRFGFRHIALIGSGHVAGFLGKVFKAEGFQIDYIISRNINTGKALANIAAATYSSDYAILKEVDLIIIAVKDDAIAEVAASLQETDAMVCHTAGAVSMNCLNAFKHHGVLYPLQSISGALNPTEVPILIEGNEVENTQRLIQFIEACGFAAKTVNSEQRLDYHLAAVFANNFSNAIIAAAEKISKEKDLDMDLLKPLIRHTFENALVNGAINSQTGPAIRNDLATMKKHIDLLTEHKDLQTLYKLLSEYITIQQG